MSIAQIVAASETFACTPVSVWDGDGPIRCAEGPKIRLAAIATCELDGSCRRGQPCPRVSGTRARDQLVQLLGGARDRTRDRHVLVNGPRLACRSRGPDDYGRTVAWCSAPAIGDLSCRLVRDKVALSWRSYGGSAVCRSAGSPRGKGT